MKKLILLFGLLLAATQVKALPICITNVQAFVHNSSTVFYVNNSGGTGITEYSDDSGNHGYKGGALYSSGANACSNAVDGVWLSVQKPCGATDNLHIQWQCNTEVDACWCSGDCYINIPLGPTETFKTFKIVHNPHTDNQGTCNLAICNLFVAQPCNPNGEP